MSSGKPAALMTMFMNIVLYEGMYLNLVIYFHSLIKALIFIIYKKRSIKSLVRQIDFILLLIIFFAVKSIYLKTYDIYDGCNHIVVSNLVKAVLLTFPADFIFVITTFLNMVQLPLSHVGKIFTLTLIIIFAVIIINCVFRKNKLIEVSSQYTINLDRKKFTLSDYMAYFLSGIVVLGIIRFNILYINFQSDYCRQLAFQANLIDYREELQERKNILCLTQDYPDTIRFYSLNANVSIIFGDESHFMLNSPGDVTDQIFNIPLTSKLGCALGNIKDYYTSHKNIDAVIIYNCEISYLQTLRLKFFELIHDVLF